MRGRNFVVTIIVALTLLLGVPAIAQGSLPKNVERWRPVVRATLKTYHVYSKFWEDKELHIIYGESRGNEHTGHINGCYGLLQFNRGWVRHGTDWRKSGASSIRRFAKALKQGGNRAILTHWRATYY
jgi:hypothetical protein